MGEKWDKVKTHLLVTVLYLGLSLFFTYPLVLKFFTHIPGSGSDGSDGWFFVWNLWWMKKALLDLHTNPLYTNYILYPLGASLVFHPLTIFNGLISISLQSLFGLVGSNNIILILSFVLSGYGTFLLVDYIVNNKIAAFIAGIIFAFSPYKLAHVLTHFDLITGTGWISFYVLFLIKTVKEPRIKNAFLAGLFLLFTALSAYYYLVYLLMFTALYIGYIAISNRSAILNVKFVKKFSILATTFAVGFSPIFYFAVRDVLKGEYRPVPGWGAGEVYVADLLGFITPSVQHPLFGKLAAEISNKFMGHRVEWTVFVGYTVLILALFASIRYFRKKDIKFWVFSGVIFFLLSLGPTLRVLGKRWPAITLFSLHGLDVGIPLPYIALHLIPFINSARIPSRFSIMMMLSLAILVGYACAFIFFRLSGAKRNPKILTVFVAGLIFALISFEYLAIPLPLLDASVPKIYREIAQEKEDFSILEIPLGWRDGYDIWGVEETRIQYFQTVHGKRLLGGVVGRIPNNKPLYYYTFPVIGTIPYVEGNIKSVIEALHNYIARDQKAVDTVTAFFDIKYVVIHKPFIDSKVDTYVNEVFTLKKVFDSNDVRAYKIVGKHLKDGLKIDLGTDNSQMYFVGGWSGEKALTEDWSENRISNEGVTFAQVRRKESSIFVPFLQASPQMMTIRLRAFRQGKASGQKITLFINSKALSSLKLSDSWTEYKLSIPARYLKSGLNKFTFRFKHWRPLSAVAFDYIHFSPLHATTQKKSY